MRLLTLDLKPRRDITRRTKLGYKWPQKWRCPTKNIYKKNKSAYLILHVLIYGLIFSPSHEDGYVPDEKNSDSTDSDGDSEEENVIEEIEEEIKEGGIEVDIDV